MREIYISDNYNKFEVLMSNNNYLPLFILL